MKLWTKAAVTCVLATTVATLDAAAEPLRVAYNQWVGLSPLFIAQDKGFFKEAGIEVEPREFAGPGESLAPLIAGHLDISMTTADNVVLLNAQGQAPVLITSVLDMSDGGDAIVAKKEIKSVKDLKGKTIGSTIGEVNHLLLLKALDTAGMTQADVNVVNMSADDSGAAFIAGNLDAAVTWEPWVSKAVEADGHAVFTSKSAPNLLVDVMAVTKETLADREKELAAFTEAMGRAVQFMEEHPSEAHAIAAKWLNVTPEDVKAMLEGVKIYKAEEIPPLLAAGGGMHESLASITKFMKAQGTITDAPAPAAMISMKLVGDGK